MTARRGVRKSPKKPVKKGARAPRRGPPADPGGAAEPTTTAAGGLGFPVVGLGASAGGLEAFEEFFRHVPPDTGMAFVLVSHLDPSHASILTEILQRSTPIPVVEAQDQMPVVRGRIHVIPPNRDMALFHGVLQLTVPTAPRGQRMPIDTFLRSLAEDQAENAIGIVLSGTGSDGTLGLRSILGAGGVTLVQDPATAKYDGMPAAAIRAGYATQVLPPEKMPEALEAGLPRDPRPAPLSTVSRAGGLSQILMLLRSSTGHDFSQYKKSTVGRRIDRRMALHGIDDLKVYARLLEERPAELKLLFRELLINVTSFFRDPEAFEVLKREVLPQLLSDRPEGYVFRVWVAACATGEEAYSIAMVLREYVEEARLDCKIQIYATDIDEDAISTARTGVYPPNIVEDVSPERLRRFFVKGDEGYRVKKELREMVVLATQNVTKDPPFTRLDLLSCRNLMIYLEPDLQERLVEIFGYALKPGGVLFLSPSESVGGRTDLFAAIQRKWKLFRVTHSAALARTAIGGGPHWVSTGASLAHGGFPKAVAEASIAELTRQALLREYAPASVVTDRAGNILYVHGNTGKYLRPAPGRPSLNVMAMAREGLERELRAAFQGATGRRQATSRMREVPVRTSGGVQVTTIGVHPIRTSGGREALFLVSFREVARTPPARRPGRAARTEKPRGRAKALEAELARSREFLRATVEEHRGSTEDLRSMNEELQSVNEELQSTNEELETSKEELQSVNEELVTVNAELQAKIEQLAGMQNDMRNLLDSVAVGVILLDGQLAIRRFTPLATRILRIVATDVGRPLADIKTDVQGDELLASARAVLDTLVPWEREIVTTGGASYLARIQPYRTLDNVIDGVVMTFTDISARVRAEGAVQEARDVAESLVDGAREPLVVLERDLTVFSASRAFYEQFQLAPEEVVGRTLYQLGEGQWDIPELRELLETRLPREGVCNGYVLEHDFAHIGHRRIVLDARRIVDRSGETRRVLLSVTDVGPGSDGPNVPGAPPH